MLFPYQKTNTEYTRQAAAFIQEVVGIRVHEQPDAHGFLGAGVEILQGELLVDFEIAKVSDLLHEAGHLAIIPGKYRSKANKNIDEVIGLMCLDTACLAPDHPLQRAIMQCGDQEATAWAYAAGVAAEIPQNLIIQNEEYQGNGAEVRFCISKNCFGGINGLQHAGFCMVKNYPYNKNIPVYPRLAKWLQDDFEEAITIETFIEESFF